MDSRSRLRGRLHLEKNGNPFLSGSRIDLLEAIDKHGSITRAARAVDMSYKGAWDAVDAMNNQADEPVVERAPGGRRGGGTRLTDYGRRVLTLVRSIEREYQQALTLLDERGAEFGEYRQLLRRFSLRTSARNLWAGTVEKITSDRVRTRVDIALDAQTVIVAHVSTESAVRLNLQPGQEVFALVKAVSVSVSQDDPSTPAPDRQVNEFHGRVLRCTRESSQLDLTIELPGGKTVVAVTPADPSLARIEAGSALSVRFDPNGVVLVML